MLTEEKQKEVMELCKKMIQARSYSGEEQLVVNVLKSFFEGNEFDEVIVDDYGNIIGHICGKTKGPSILFDGHMDTVLVTNEEEWIHAPFAAEIEDGKIYGRGTSDMKGALAAMACAAASFAKQTKKEFAGDIYVAGVVHEECFEGVAARSISQLVKPDYVIIGEASSLNLKVGQRGRAEIVLETHGKPAHSANPEKGINAVYKMAKIIEEIRKLVPPVHPVLGLGIMELTDIKSSPYPGASVVPEYCRATYDRRLLVGETKADVLEPIKALIDKMKAKDCELKATVSYAMGKECCYTKKEITGERFFPGWLYDRDEDYIQKIKHELEGQGYAPDITQYNFCTNGSHYAGEAGIKTIGFGPSHENLAHTVDEYIEIEQLIGACDGYYYILKALL
ncbi:MAG: YgeY family selenium metabolism-linked hydrolase [Velocimicrobium sp.]